MSSITEAELIRAIERTLVARGKMPPQEARPVARMVLGYFGADDTVLDNKLSSDDRDRFYQLEEEDATVSRGKTWRIHYWLLKKARIRDVGQGGEAPPTDEAERVYRSIGEADWSRTGRTKPPSGS